MKCCKLVGIPYFAQLEKSWYISHKIGLLVILSGRSHAMMKDPLWTCCAWLPWVYALLWTNCKVQQVREWNSCWWLMLGVDPS